MSGSRSALILDLFEYFVLFCFDFGEFAVIILRILDFLGQYLQGILLWRGFFVFYVLRVFF